MPYCVYMSPKMHAAMASRVTCDADSGASVQFGDSPLGSPRGWGGGRLPCGGDRGTPLGRGVGGLPLGGGSPLWRSVDDVREV